MTKNIKDPAGRALYLEFHNSVYTYQAILTPQSVAIDGSNVMPAFISRRISVSHPRRNWGITKASSALTPSGSRGADGNIEKLSHEHTVPLIAEHYWLSAPTFRSLALSGWKMYREPLVVEYSYKDLQDISSGKTPNELYRRIERSRKAKGWGDSLFSTTTSAV